MYDASWIPGSWDIPMYILEKMGLMLRRSL